jgi:putative ABC transport system permease protein
MSSLSGLTQAVTDTFRGAFHTLGSNKLRSALTLLGIVIGVMAVVSMSATIEGMRGQVNHDLAQLGTGVFQVQKQPINGGGFGGDRGKYEKRKNFTLGDVELLQQHCEQCLHVAGEAWEGGQTAFGPHGTSLQRIQVVGGTPYFFENNGYGLANGRLLNDGEVGRAADVIVIGSDLVDALFPDSDPIGQDIRVQSQVYRVIGTLERRGSSMGGSMDSLAVIPVTHWVQVYGARQSLNVTIMAKDPGRVAYAQDEVVSLLRRYRGVAPQDENDFEMFSNASMQEDFQSLAGKIAIVTIAVVAISLFIAGIGVMNIMLVAVTERTSEIGVRRALGARRRRILAQFVLEAIVLCLVGGALGVLMGWFVAYLVKVLGSLPTTIAPLTVAMALIASSLVGLTFGIYPAWRASRLDPVEAMRQE